MNAIFAQEDEPPKRDGGEVRLAAKTVFHSPQWAGVIAWTLKKKKKLRAIWNEMLEQGINPPHPLKRNSLRSYYIRRMGREGEI